MQAMTILRFAARDLRSSLRGGLRGFRIFLLCLALGATVIAAVGSLSAGINAGIAADGKAILGGDLEFRLIYRTTTPEEMAALQADGTVSHSLEMRAMLRPATPTAAGQAAAGQAVAGKAPDAVTPTLVEVKAVDGRYPLYGAVAISPPQDLARALAREPDDSFGALVEPTLQQRFKLKPGDQLQLGDARLTVSGVLDKEPDRGAQIFGLGPRLMLSPDALAASNLLQPGSLAYHVYRLKLRPGIDANALKTELTAQFPSAGWRIRGIEDAASGMRDFLTRTAQYMNLVGFCALLIGGLGIANAVRAFLEGKARSLAVLKCLGASTGQIFGLYLLLVGIMSAVGIVIGLALGSASPFLLGGALAGFNVPVLAAVYPLPLLVAAGISVLTALVFALAPLLKARRVKPAQLFRAGPVELGDLGRGDLLLLTLAAAALAGSAILAASNLKLAVGFVAAAALTLVAFNVLALLLKKLAGWARQRAVGSGRALRFALADIARRQSPTTSIVLSLGLGLTVLVTIALIQHNMLRDLQQTVPDQAPSFYFIDIQPQQLDGFDRFARDFPGAGALTQVPMLRGRIAKVKDIPADAIKPTPDIAWVLKGDRGITWAANAPANAKITDGKWWAADYQGPTLVSIDAKAAQGLGLKIGDQITVNVLGRDIPATIANLREIDWSSLDINFVMVFSPGILQKAPQTYIATLRVPPEHEGDLVAAMAQQFPTISAIRVKEALASAIDILQAVAGAIRATAAVTLAAGMLVLAGAIAAGRERRIYEAVLLKMLGGTSGDVARGYLWEYGIAAVVSALIALGIGSLAAYLFLTQVLDIGWSFPPGLAAIVIGLSLVITLSVGFLGSWRALRARTAPYLRNE
ncbi:MAG TPA: FtsX-like permease family protein [Dongiaceae bacterium]|nr:FtsX-like permease family protein [Dongiaceae bacterium]